LVLRSAHVPCFGTVLQASDVRLTIDWQAIFRDFLRSSEIWMG
jgi:hypothetical protein